MKLRRFTSDGVAAVRETLPKIEETGDLSLAEALVEKRDLTEDIPELSSVDLDPDRVFPTTYAFCEYFHSLMKDHKPLSYRTDVGFWTWLAMVYVKQLVHMYDTKIDVGQEARLVLEIDSHVNVHRHLLATAYYLYMNYVMCPSILNVVLVHPINSVSDVVEQVVSRQNLLQNPAVLKTLNVLYFDDSGQSLKRGAGGVGPGAVRRFIAVLDQFSMNRDFFELQDAEEIVNMLPPEFSKFLNK